jgi:hypothetical protein
VNQGNGQTHGDRAAPAPSASPSTDPYANVVPVRASVAPVCVAPGKAVRLTVHSAPGAFLGYQAVYSDGKGGGTPPWGAGYGGNDKGRTGGDGGYATAWTLAPNTPPGAAYVDVIVADHGHFGRTRVAFDVAHTQLTGGCS